jgi:hypothetical protein
MVLRGGLRVRSCDDALGTGLSQSQITYLINILKAWVVFLV